MEPVRQGPPLRNLLRGHQGRLLGPPPQRGTARNARADARPTTRRRQVACNRGRQRTSVQQVRDVGASPRRPDGPPHRRSDRRGRRPSRHDRRTSQIRRCGSAGRTFMARPPDQRTRHSDSSSRTERGNRARHSRFEPHSPLRAGWDPPTVFMRCVNTNGGAPDPCRQRIAAARRGHGRLGGHTPLGWCAAVLPFGKVLGSATVALRCG